jgi:hypothetical protein
MATQENKMEITKFMAMGCFLLAVPQGIDACLRLHDRLSAKRWGTKATAPNGFRTFLAVLLLAGTFLTIGLGSWLWINPMKPVVVEKPVTIERLIPCPTPPPTKSGNATTKGANSPASTGSGNSFNYGSPAPTQPQNQPSKKE